jgi:branched-chain amino acid transport system ATP-binding protein
MIEVKDLYVSYGYVEALRGVSLSILDEKITAVLGANGAGKSTLLSSITRIAKIKSGNITFNGSELPQTTNKVVEIGISLVPEGRKVFPNLSVKENLIMGTYLRRDSGIDRDFEKVFSYFPKLKSRIKQRAGTLSGGEQQMLAIGRGLMANPRILMLDEPSLGLAPIIVEQIFEVISEIKEEGKTVLLIEQNANQALGICDYGYVLENGRITFEGTGDVLLSNNDIQKAYLGV